MLAILFPCLSALIGSLRDRSNVYYLPGSDYTILARFWHDPFRGDSDNGRRDARFDRFISYSVS